jgi:hypothetical protein
MFCLLVISCSPEQSQYAKKAMLLQKELYILFFSSLFLDLVNKFVLDSFSSICRPTHTQNKAACHLKDQ